MNKISAGCGVDFPACNAAILLAPLIERLPSARCWLKAFAEKRDDKNLMGT